MPKAQTKTKPSETTIGSPTGKGGRSKAAPSQSGPTGPSSTSAVPNSTGSGGQPISAGTDNEAAGQTLVPSPHQLALLGNVELGTGENIPDHLWTPPLVEGLVTNLFQDTSKPEVRVVPLAKGRFVAYFDPSGLTAQEAGRVAGEASRDFTWVTEPSQISFTPLRLPEADTLVSARQRTQRGRARRKAPSRPREGAPEESGLDNLNNNAAQRLVQRKQRRNARGRKGNGGDDGNSSGGDSSPGRHSVSSRSTSAASSRTWTSWANTLISKGGPRGKPALPKFGEKDTAEEYRSWRHALLVHKARGYPESSLWPAVLSSLVGTPSAIMQQLGPNPSLSELIRSLGAHYDRVESEYALYNAFTQTTQRKNEEIRAYAVRLQEASQALLLTYPNTRHLSQDVDRTLGEAFYEGLQPEIRAGIAFKVETDPWPDFQQILNHARECEGRLKRQKELTRATPPARPTSGPGGDAAPKAGTKGGKPFWLLRGKKAQAEEPEEDSPDPQDAPVEVDVEDLMGSLDEEAYRVLQARFTSRNAKDGACFGCGALDHQIKDCTHPDVVAARKKRAEAKAKEMTKVKIVSAKKAADPKNGSDGAPSSGSPVPPPKQK